MGCVNWSAVRIRCPVAHSAAGDRHAAVRIQAWFRNGDRHLAGVHFLRPNRYSARSQSPFLNQARIHAGHAAGHARSPPRRTALLSAPHATLQRQLRSDELPGKIRTEHFAQRTCSARWTTAALDSARRQANELLRPDGYLAPTPAQCWAARNPITDPQRDALTQSVASIAAQIQEAQRLTNPEKLPTINPQSRLFRAAVRRALLDLGLLSINPRSITPPFILQKRAKIS